ncbi:MAG: hypothetical protein K5695_08590, partial [Oscillospiraceae bacterium]|nr:hypothetical protein [Oscillospiraceae bacterium]
NTNKVQTCDAGSEIQVALRKLEAMILIQDKPNCLPPGRQPCSALSARWRSLCLHLYFYEMPVKVLGISKNLSFCFSSKSKTA